MSALPDSKKKARWKTGIRIAFQIAAFMALLYVLREFYRQWPAVSQWRPRAGHLAIIPIISVLYGGSLFLLADMWRRLIAIFHPGQVPANNAYAVYAETQIAKYLPGNVFQYVGRHVLLAHYKIAQGSILKISILEIFVTLAGALFVVALALPAGLEHLTYVPTPVAKAMILLVGISLLILVYLALPNERRSLPIMLKLFGLSFVFFCIQSIIFLIIAALMGWSLTLSPVFASSVSWVIGFVVPGAPGGLGAREFSLLFLLKPDHPEGTVLIAIALFRFVTLCGDAVCFAIGKTIRKTPSTLPIR